MTLGNLPHPQSVQKLELLIHRSSVPPEGLPEKEVNKSLNPQPFVKACALALPSATRLPEAGGGWGICGVWGAWGRTHINQYGRRLQKQASATQTFRKRWAPQERLVCTVAGRPDARSTSVSGRPALEALGQARWPEPEPEPRTRPAGEGSGCREQRGGTRRSSTPGMSAARLSRPRGLGSVGSVGGRPPTSRGAGAPRLSHPGRPVRTAGWRWPELARRPSVPRWSPPAARRPPGTRRRCPRAGAQVIARGPVPTSARSAIPIARASRDG